MSRSRSRGIVDSSRETVVYWRGSQQCMPCKHYDLDAGADLVTIGDVVVPPRAHAEVPLGLAIALPPGHVGFIMGRSSTVRRRGLIVVTSVIDAGFRGELFVAVFNPNMHGVRIRAGDRIAQLVVMPVSSPKFMRVDKLPEGDRGNRGVGSTGSGDNNPDTNRAGDVRVAYLAGPIDAASNDESVGVWRDHAVRVLANAGWTIFSPAGAWRWARGNKGGAMLISEVNDFVLSRVGLVVALLPPGVATQGTIEEVINAERRGIATIVVTEPSSTVFVINRQLTCTIDELASAVAEVGGDSGNSK